MKKDYKIYLLGNDNFYLNIFQQHFFNLGYTNISIFNNSAECFDKLSQQPDIIFFDHGVDFLRGLEVLKTIKKFSPDIYIIFLCGAEEVEIVIQSLKYGAFDYFVKGEKDAKNIEMTLIKIDQIRELLERNNITRFKKFGK